MLVQHMLMGNCVMADSESVGLRLIRPILYAWTVDVTCCIVLVSLRIWTIVSSCTLPVRDSDIWAPVGCRSRLSLSL
jgi:hypothetical protein